MNPQPWHLIALTVLALLTTAAVMLSPATGSGTATPRASRLAPLAGAALLLGLSGWLLWTPVLDQARVDTDVPALIAAPALVGAFLAAVAARRFVHRGGAGRQTR